MALLTVAVILGGCATSPETILKPVAARPIQSQTVAIDAKEADAAPVMTRNVPPEYPYELRERGVVGKAVVFFVITTDGHTTDAQVLEADDERFAASALEAVRQWRFKPTTKNGVRVRCRMVVPMLFGLNGAMPE